MKETSGKYAGSIDLERPENAAFLAARAEGKRTVPRRSTIPPLPAGFKAMTPEDTDDEEDEDDEKEDLRSIPGARLAKIRADVRFRQIEIAERMGQLIDRKIVESAMTGIIQACQFFTEIPVKLAMQISDATGRPDLRTEIEDILSLEIQHALENLKAAAIATTRAGKKAVRTGREETQEEKGETKNDN